MVARHAVLALLAVVASAGCHGMGFRTPPVRPEPIALKPAVPEVREVITRWNENARKVASLEAHPSINVVVGTTGAFHGLVKGDMAVQRPRNFRLTLERPSSLTEEADLGSNDREFWFWWNQNNRDKAIYVCDYDGSGPSPLAAAMQPDWIVEAMGLREIPEAEVASLSSRIEGSNRILTSRRRDAKGELVLKETVLDVATGRIKEHRLVGFDGKRRTALAEATIPKMQQVLVPAGEEGGAETTVTLPKSITLVWHRPQRFQMEVFLDEVKVNPDFNDEQRAYLFTVPKKQGYARRNLSNDRGMVAGGTTIRETRPAPPSRSATDTPPATVHLDEPIPFGIDERGAEAEATSPSLPALPPVSRSTAIPVPERVVGARIPTAPESYPLEVNTLR